MTSPIKTSRAISRRSFSQSLDHLVKGFFDLQQHHDAACDNYRDDPVSKGRQRPGREHDQYGISVVRPGSASLSRSEATYPGTVITAKATSAAPSTQPP